MNRTKNIAIIGIILSLLLVSACSSPSQNTLRVGMDLRFFPFTGMDNQGNPSGVEVDIAKAFGEFIGKDVEIINTEFSMLIPALQSEEIDIIIGSMSITEEREKTVDFSDPYLYDKIVVLLNKGFAEEKGISDAMPVEDFLCIPGTRFIGIIGSIAVSIPESYGYEVGIVTTDAVAEREIASGGSDALLGAYTLYGMHHTNRETTVMYKKPIVSSASGMAVQKGNEELLHQANLFIAKMESSGINDQLRQDWNKEIGIKLFDPDMTLDYYLSL